jgi:hypothetical protein
VSKVVTLFLSWLNFSVLAPLPLGTVIGIFYLIGLGMFLLPPVPGVPVYLTGGVVIVNKLINANIPGVDFGMAILMTTIICSVLKLNAVAMQQKCFGEQLGSRIAIRAFVGVNSNSIRAIKCILEKPGLGIQKVCVLCGGPDWPTSVLTGILGLPLRQMMLGTLPIFFVIGPCVMAGAFQLRKSEGEMYTSLAYVAIIGASLAQLVALLAACFFIERMADEKKEMLEALPKDKEVEALDARNRQKNVLYQALTDWDSEDMPNWVRALLTVGALCMGVPCYIFQLFGDFCFEVFDVTSTIDCPASSLESSPSTSSSSSVSSSSSSADLATPPPCLNGNALNLVKPFGYCVLLPFGFGCICLWVYSRWAGAAVKAGLKKKWAQTVVGAKGRQG